MRLLLLVLLPVLMAAQVCVKQPPVSLNGVAEWACQTDDYPQAWRVLSENGVAPVRQARISDLAIRGNYRSKKQTIIRALKVIGFGTGIVAGILINNDNNDLSDLQLGALISGPKVAEAGITFFSKAPDEFTPLPDDNGFVTIYSLPTNQVIVGGAQASTRPAVDNNIWGSPNRSAPERPQYIVESTPDAQVGVEVPPELTGLLSTDDLANPRSESDMRWIAEYYRSRMNFAEAEAVLTRGYQVEMLVAVK